MKDAAERVLFNHALGLGGRIQLVRRDGQLYIAVASGNQVVTAALQRPDTEALVRSLLDRLAPDRAATVTKKLRERAKTRLYEQERKERAQASAVTTNPHQEVTDR